MATSFGRGTDPDAKGDAPAEIQASLDAGVAGVFSDYADTTVDARDSWLAERAGRAG